MKTILSMLHAFFIQGWIPMDFHLHVGPIHLNLTLVKLDVRAPTIGATVSVNFHTRSSFLLVFEGYAGFLGMTLDVYNDHGNVTVYDMDRNELWSCV